MFCDTRNLNTETMDVCQQSELYVGWDVTFHQFSTGQFQGRGRSLVSDGFQAILEESNRALLKKGSVGHGSTVVSVPLEGPEAPANEILICSGKSLPEVLVPDNFSVLTVSIDRDSLDTVLEDMQMSLTLPLKPLRCHSAAAEWQFIKRALWANDYLAEELDLNGLKDLVIRKVINDVAGADPVECLNARQRTVERAIQWYLQHISESPGIADICHQIGVSRGKLQYSFIDVYGIAPLTFFKLLRLNCIHKELYAHHGKVSDVAARYGVTHLSRFSDDYRKLFGRLPSHTSRGKNTRLMH